MRIYLCCPKCGGNNWILRTKGLLYKDGEPIFACLNNNCGTICDIEDMEVIDSEGYKYTE